MAIDGRTIREDELVPWLDAQTTAFLVRPDAAKIAEEVRQHSDFSRIRGPFEATLRGGLRSSDPHEHAGDS